MLIKEQSTPDEVRESIVVDLRRMLPDLDLSALRREVSAELDQFGDAPVKQYIPVLVARAVREHHR